ncbi:MAG TPA: O-antigen ligase family protein [Solirubrobacterales bacterium]|nr:O-antigen ligase family protein [Solirubrobacterales bacterium]
MSDVLAGVGVVAVGSASAAAILLPPGRLRSLVMVAAMVLFPVLIAGDQWHTTQIVDLRDSPDRITALAVGAAAAVAALTYLFRRWPTLMPLAIVFAIPFRVPLHAGGDTANLLVPLYLVIAAAVVATLLRDWTRPLPAHPPRALAWMLAAVILLYSLQVLYSADFSKGLQNLCFFFVPFTLAYRLLREVEWDRRLLRWALIVIGVEAVAFVLVGSVEYAAKSLFWNDQIIRSNEFHTYFRVNSVFWDPNVYGRYLALVTVIATAAMLWARTRESFWLLSGLILVLWIGLVPTFSQSSYLALLAGLAMLAAIRWSWRWTLAVVAVGFVGAVLVVVLVGGSGKITSDRLNVDLSGRGSLVSGGADLFGERPLWGYGSGSFQRAYRDHRANKDAPVTVSHTEPVTVAAEQGLIGLAAYLGLIAVALWTLGSGLWTNPPPPLGNRAARAAVMATFVALLVHTLAYAGFFEDPITWVLLAVGASLAHAAVPAVREPA